MCLGFDRPILDEVRQVDYELSDAEYAANEVEDTWVQGLLAGLGAYLNTLQPLLTPANYEQLVTLLLEKVHTRNYKDILMQSFHAYTRSTSSLAKLTCVS